MSLGLNRQINWRIQHTASWFWRLRLWHKLPCVI